MTPLFSLHLIFNVLFIKQIHNKYILNIGYAVGTILGTAHKMMEKKLEQKLKVLALLEVIFYCPKWTINKQENEYITSCEKHLQNISQI